MFRKLHKLGRCCHAVSFFSKTVSLSNYSIYGESDGHDLPEAAPITSSILTACYYEQIAQGGGPCFFCIDFNADPEDIPFLDYLLHTACWIDLGAKADLWGGIPYETTCMAPNSNKPTRRDYIFAHPEIIPAITNVTVAPPAPLPFTKS
jgi:hypothetical protein